MTKNQMPNAKKARRPKLFDSRQPEFGEGRNPKFQVLGGGESLLSFPGSNKVKQPPKHK
jgi:hypothetical protein